MNREMSYAEQFISCENTILPADEDRFATEPANAVRLIMQRLDEEALYTLFEQAISDRLEAVSERLRLCSRPTTREPVDAGVRRNYSQKVVTSIFPVGRISSSQRWPWLAYVWQRYIIFASLALMLIMIGFDLMGALVLRLH